MTEKIIQKLHDLLLAEEQVPFWDDAEVVTIKGGDAKIRAEAIRECLNIIKSTCLHDNN